MNSGPSKKISKALSQLTSLSWNRLGWEWVDNTMGNGRCVLKLIEPKKLKEN